MSLGKLGRIVWNDLFTANENASKLFYERVAGWTYVTQHAANFAWGGGERDFVLALACDEAGAGFVSCNSGPLTGWVPYIEVLDVASVAVAATQNGGSVARPPFEVPGVGRNCLLRDPLGVHFGISLSRHSFPAPTKQFGIERYLLGDRAFPTEFYNQLFDWDMTNVRCTVTASPTTTMAGDTIATFTVDTVGRDEAPAWLPGIRVGCFKTAVDDVEVGGGAVLNSLPQGIGGRAAALISDPLGALAYLVAQ